MRPTLALALLLAAALHLPGSAESGPRQAIQRAYDDAAYAVSLKYVPGVMAMRAPGYRAMAPDGAPVDVRGERDRFQNLISPALSAHETVRIESFQQTDARHARCVIHDVVDIVRLVKRKPMRLTMESRCDDGWVLTPKGWKQETSHILQQSFNQDQEAGSKT
jgi:hypothetical protein